MKCIHCGREMPDGARFCAGCGNEMSAAPEPVTNPSQSTNVSETNTVQSPEPKQQPTEQAVFHVPTGDPIVNGESSPSTQSGTSRLATSIPQAPPPIGPASVAQPTSNKPVEAVEQNVQQPMYGAPVQQAPPNPYAPYGQAVPPSPPAPVKEDEKSVGLNILSFFIPIVGIVLWAVNKNEKPKQSKSIIHSAIGGIATAITMSLIGVLITLVGTFAMIGGVAGGLAQNEDSIQYEENIETTQSSNADSTSGVTTGGQKLDWNNIQVSIDGKELSLPCDYKTFLEKTNFTQVSDEATETLEKDEYTRIYCEDKNGNEISIQLYNDTETPKTTTDTSLKVVGVSVSSDSCSVKIVAPCGFSLGDPWEPNKFASTCGTPDNLYTGSAGYASRSWENPNDVFSDIEFTTYDGKTIDEIDVTNFGE